MHDLAVWFLDAARSSHFFNAATVVAFLANVRARA
jgi:hypothetical protein